jgi:hypothetical protein
MVGADYSTGVGLELAFYNIAILVTTFPILMLMAPQLPGYGAITVIGVYVLYSVICAGILWFLGPWKGKSVT